MASGTQIHEVLPALGVEVVETDEFRSRSPNRRRDDERTLGVRGQKCGWPGVCPSSISMWMPSLAGSGHVGSVAVGDPVPFQQPASLWVYALPVFLSRLGL